MVLADASVKFRINERISHARLESALLLKRYRDGANRECLRRSAAFCLSAVNGSARIKWGHVFIEEAYNFFDIPENEHAPNEQVFHVTLAESSGLKTYEEKIDLSKLKRKFQSNLKGLSYVGMIEPGYYNAIYDDFGQTQKNLVSWHAHFLVWDISEADLKRHLEKIKPRFKPISPDRCAVHKKAIKRGRFGRLVGYIIKSPCKEYSIGRRSERHPETGAFRYKQNKRNIRPGTQVELFKLMQGMYLDRLAMAGGGGRELLGNIKYEALRDYRKRYGRDERRP